jgi:hypothetical protein
VFRVALALSALVVLGCAIWWTHITSSDSGPDRSVDFRPLGPIVVGAAALIVIWVLTIFVAALAAQFRDDDDPAA